MVKLFEMPSKQEFLSRFFELSPEYQPNGKPSAELVKANLAKVFEKGYARFEQVHQLIDGTPVPCEITLVRVPHGNGFNICGYMRDLREEKRMLAEIYDTNERVRIMLDSTPLCATLFDEEFNPVYCNQEAVNLFELRDKQEYLGRFFELSPEYQPNGLSTREVAVKNLKTAFSNGYYRFEHIHQKLDGTPVPAEITLVRVQRGDGYIVVGYARDLREEKKILAEKQEADERAAIMLDMTPMACALFDMNGNVIDCNKESIRMAGFDSKQEFCERFFDLSPEYQPNGRLSAEMRHEKFSAAVQTGYQRYEWMYQALDGSSMPSEITLVRVKKEDSFIIAGYGRDLRELKEHEAALERDRRRMNDLLELARMTDSEEHELIDFTINSVAALTNSSMGYVVLLEHAKEVLPFRSVVLDKKIDCMLPLVTEHGTPHTLSRYLTECIEKRQAVIQDDFAALPGKRVFPDGHTKVRSHMNFPILDGDRHIGIIGVGNKETPYTEVDAKQLMLLGQGLSSQLNRKRYAENLERAKREAEDANKAKSEFLAHMSHEIRTPLNGVIGLSDLLVGTPLNDKQHEYVQLINASGNALLFLINDILDFSKIEAGRLEIESEPFDLSATVGAVIASLASRTSSKDLELAISFSQYLPRVVQGDSGRIRQILLNLAGNALKFTEQGGVWVNVVMESMNETTVTIKFIVTDTGIGISSNHINRLFEAFAQADVSTARVYGGTGLGLAISMKLVQLMGGTIGVESEQGKGSTFWFKIPFVCDPLTLQCLREQKCLETVDKNCSYLEGRQCTAFINRAITEGYQIKGRSVLVVDNSAIHREALSVQLRQWEMECMDCGSGEEALRLSEIQLKKEKPFDLFVIDHTLSDGTGIDLVRQLLEREKIRDGILPAQIILLFPLSEDYEQYAFDNSRVESISKPVFASALFDAVMNRFFSAEKPPSGNFGIFDAESADNSDDASKTVKSKPGRHIKQRLHMENRPISSLAGKVHILVVEDNKINQIVAKNLLEEAGFSCDVVTNGIEACNAVRQKDYDIVLMDCLMPEMDGFEATDLIRKWEREHGKKRLPIIALTANATKEDVRKCFDVGMDAYCSKPIDARAVVQQIETWYKKSN
ncbi:MAG: response regulator [Planctomycetaceae bacterium]|nr:response regulator [Planctomycetaceae bacterium]